MDWRWMGLPEWAAMRVKGADWVLARGRTGEVAARRGRRLRRVVLVVCILGGFVAMVMWILLMWLWLWEVDVDVDVIVNMDWELTGDVCPARSKCF